MPTAPHDPMTAGWRLEHLYSTLPELLFSRTFPVPVSSPDLLILNQPFARDLGLDPDALALSSSAGIFTGNVLPPGAAPIAQAYAGHQFGGFTNLGDGRAILLGEQITPDGRRFDVQLKGAGRTPYSRGGDGRAAVGPMLREYIISEAMHALRIPTTRSLAVAATGEQVVRQELLPGAVLTRIAASHIRVGTFQFAAAHEDHAALLALADHAIDRHFPELPAGPSRYFAFYEAAMDRQAALVASWLHVGFIHGVMNTDNMALSGETIDYGPCAFIDHYHPDTVFSSIDRQGRYAYGQQASIARWNLARLAEALLPLFDPDQGTAVDLANEALTAFESRFHAHWLLGMRAKLGLFTAEKEDAALVQQLLDWMQANQQDFTHTFRSLSHESALAEPAVIDAGFIAWHERWSARLARQPQPPCEVVAAMRATNPAVIPRNHKVEEALAAATAGDLSPTHRLLEVLSRPFEDPATAEYTAPAPAGSAAYQTFCGT